MRTSGYVMQNLPNPDGHIVISPDETCFVSNAADNRSSKGQIYKQVTGAATAIMSWDLSKLVYRYGMQDDSQMQYGMNNGTSGAQALPLLPGTIFNSPYPSQARPPVTSAQLFGNNTGNASVVPKGILLKAVNVVYQTSFNNATSLTFGLSKTIFANNAAPVVTDIIVPGLNGLSLAAVGQPQVVNIPVPTVNQVMLTSRLSRYIAEINVVIPGGTYFTVLGLFLDVAYNFN